MLHLPCGVHLPRSELLGQRLRARPDSCPDSCPDCRIDRSPHCQSNRQANYCSYAGSGSSPDHEPISRTHKEPDRCPDSDAHRRSCGRPDRSPNEAPHRSSTYEAH